MEVALEEAVRNAQAEVELAQSGVKIALAAIDSVQAYYENLNAELIEWKIANQNYTGKEERFVVMIQERNKVKVHIDKAYERVDKAFERLDKENAYLKENQKHDKSSYKHPRKKVKISLQEFKKIVGPPSSFAKHSGSLSWRYIFQDNTQPLLCHRNNDDVEPLPVTLLSHFFTEFAHDCERIAYDMHDCIFLTKLFIKMQGIFNDEQARTDAFTELFNGYTGFNLEPPKGTRSETDGSLVQGRFLFCNLEVKNEKGLTGCDSYMQNIAYYVSKLSCIYYQQPCVLLELNGCNFGVCGIVNSRQLIVCDPLSPTYFLAKITGSEVHTKLLRLFASLKKLLSKLDTYYFEKKFEQASDLPYSCYVRLDDDCNSRQFLSFTSHIQNSTFHGYLQEEGAKKEVIIKFSERYGTVVHKYCYEQGFSPRLLAVKQVLPNLKMIVMEKGNFRDLESTDLNLLKEQCPDFLACLKDKGYVHGDLRLNNITIDEGRKRVVVLDFDWAGVHQVDDYPAFMNPEINWPVGASSGELLDHSHDEEWINRIFQMFE